jgi:hypothetical protein
MFDSSVPLDEQCTLIIDHHIAVVRFDGARVFWKIQYPWAPFLSGVAVVSIPAGQHKLTIYYADLVGRRNNEVTVQASDFEVEFNFTPGKVYTVRHQYRSDIQAQIDHDRRYRFTQFEGSYDYTKLGKAYGYKTVELSPDIFKIVIQEKVD